MMSMRMAEIHMKAVRNNNSNINVRGSAETYWEKNKFSFNETVKTKKKNMIFKFIYYSHLKACTEYQQHETCAHRHCETIVEILMITFLLFAFTKIQRNPIDVCSLFTIHWTRLNGLCKKFIHSIWWLMIYIWVSLLKWSLKFLRHFILFM